MSDIIIAIAISVVRESDRDCEQPFFLCSLVHPGLQLTGQQRCINWKNSWKLVHYRETETVLLLKTSSRCHQLMSFAILHISTSSPALFQEARVYNVYVQIKISHVFA